MRITYRCLRRECAAGLLSTIRTLFLTVRSLVCIAYCSASYSLFSNELGLQPGSVIQAKLLAPRANDVIAEIFCFVFDFVLELLLLNARFLLLFVEVALQQFVVTQLVMLSCVICSIYMCGVFKIINWRILSEMMKKNICELRLNKLESI